MTIRKINIFANEDDYSQEVRKLLQRKLHQSGFTVPKQFTPDAELIVSIERRRSLLRTLPVRVSFYPFSRHQYGTFGILSEIHPDRAG